MKPVRHMVQKWLDISPDVINDLPRIEMIGDQSIRIENYQGIVHFQPQELQLRSKIGKIKVIGEGIKIQSISSESIWFQGKILAISYIER